MKSFFLKSNFILYSSHVVNFVFGYLFILICTNYLTVDNKFQFTGFVSLFNIFLIPVSCLVLSLTGLYKNGKKDNYIYSIIYTRSLLILLTSILIICILDIFLNLNKFLQIDPKYFFLIIILLLINFFYSIENAENLAKQNFFKYSIINCLPFLIRFVLIFFTLLVFEYNKFNSVLITYIISFSFLAYNFYGRLKKSFLLKNIFKNENIEKFNFTKNFLTLSIFSVVINIDVVAARYIDAFSSTNFYIESLFGKIVFFLSTIAVLFMYPTNVQNKRGNFYNILILNLIVSLILIFIYFVGFKYLNLYLFPEMDLNVNIVLLISFSSLFFSISNMFSYKLNIAGIYIHSTLKVLLTILLIPLLFNSSNISLLIQYLIIFSISFSIIDLFFFYKNKKIIL